MPITDRELLRRHTPIMKMLTTMIRAHKILTHDIENLAIIVAGSHRVIKHSQLYQRSSSPHLVYALYSILSKCDEHGTIADMVTLAITRIRRTVMHGLVVCALQR